MKSTVLALLSLAALTGAALAQQDPAASPQNPAGQQRRAARQGAISLRTLEPLGLTDEQKTKLGDLLKKQRDEIAELRKKQLGQVMIGERRGTCDALRLLRPARGR